MIKQNKIKALKSASETEGEPRSMSTSHPTPCKKKKERKTHTNKEFLKETTIKLTVIKFKMLLFYSI